MKEPEEPDKEQSIQKLKIERKVFSDVVPAYQNETLVQPSQPKLKFLHGFEPESEIEHEVIIIPEPDNIEEPYN